MCAPAVLSVCGYAHPVCMAHVCARPRCCVCVCERPRYALYMCVLLVFYKILQLYKTMLTHPLTHTQHTTHNKHTHTHSHTHNNICGVVECIYVVTQCYALTVSTTRHRTCVCVCVRARGGCMVNGCVMCHDALLASALTAPALLVIGLRRR